MHGGVLTMRGAYVIGVALSCFVSTSARAEPWGALFEARHCQFDRALVALKYDKPEPEKRAEFDLLRARLLIQAERPDDALAAIQEMVEAHAPVPRGNLELLRGFAYAQKKELVKALDSFRAAGALGIDEDLLDGARGLAFILAGDIPKAEAALQKALKRDPKLAGALYNLACVRVSQGRVAEGAALIRQAWFLGLKDPYKLAKDPALAALRERHELVDDLLASSDASCSEY